MRERDYKTAGMMLLLSLGSAGVGLLWNHLAPKLVGFSAAAAFLGLAVAYACSWPGILGKKRSGHLLPSSYLLFWPYHLLNYLSLALFRMNRREARFNEVEPGVYLGARLFARDQPALAALQISSALDLTAEFAEVPFLRNMPAYFCIPLLDRTAPSLPELKAAVQFIRERLPYGPVYVHCALGHGRSATVVLAYLLASGKFANQEEALKYLRTKRPRIKLHPCQLRAVEQLAL